MLASQNSVGQGTIRPFLATIISRRYLAVLGVLLFCLLFLKNINGNLGTAGTIADNPLFGSAYSITPEVSSFVFANTQDYKPGYYYHLSYNVKYLGWSSGADSKPSRASINFLTDNSHGSWTPIGTLGLTGVNAGYQELYFKPSEPFHTIKFEGANIYPDVLQVFIDSIKVEALNVNAADQLLNLHKTIFGDYPITSTQQTMSATQAMGTYEFMAKKKEYGQIFKANSSNIQSVEFKMLFSGNGGLGDYKITLRSANKQGDAFAVGSDPISSFDVSSLEAKTIYQDVKTPGLYRFPMYSKLIIGNYYFVGIQNNVSFDLPNHLSLYGSSKNIYGDGLAYEKNSGKSSPKFDVYLKVYSADTRDADQPSILPSTVISDLGGSQYSFSFNESENPLSRAWANYDTSGNIIWPIALLHTPSSLTATLTPTQTKEEDITLSYSYDGRTWRDVDVSLRSASHITLNPDLPTSIIYLRYPKDALRGLTISGRLHD